MYNLFQVLFRNMLEKDLMNNTGEEHSSSNVGAAKSDHLCHIHLGLVEHCQPHDEGIITCLEAFVGHASIRHKAGS